MQLPKKILLLGSGELGKEFVISALRLGLEVMAVDRYSGAPAQQVAQHSRVIDMLDGDAIAKLVYEFKPDYIVPEIEAIRTSELLKLEKEGFCVVPSAYAAHLTMNRDEIRNLAARKLKLRTARFSYAVTGEELLREANKIGYPVVIKPVMSSSGKGQSVAKNKNEVLTSWEYAVANMRGDQKKVIVEEFIDFDYEITLLTVKQRKGKTLYCPVIGHRQERGDYQESWQPVRMNPKHLKSAQQMAKKVTDTLGGAGIYGVEFFVTKKEVIFSELSPRPHDTGMVTMISQNLTQFDLHLRAILGLPIHSIEVSAPSASAVILAKENLSAVRFTGVEKALKVPTTDIRLFGKPDARPYRRMGVALAQGKNVDEARRRAKKVASMVSCC